MDTQIVLNPVTYPNFLRFLELKGISTMQTDMSFSLSRDKGRFEWAGGSLSAFFCQPWRALDFRMWRLFYDILKFNACAKKLLINDEPTATLSIGKYLTDNGYSAYFRDDYLIVRFLFSCC